MIAIVIHKKKIINKKRRNYFVMYRLCDFKLIYHKTLRNCLIMMSSARLMWFKLILKPKVNNVIIFYLRETLLEGKL